MTASLQSSSPQASRKILAAAGHRLPQRLQSLDVFRGLTLAAMILINNPGSHTNVYRALRHANWNGCRAADLIFPFFLFVVGAATQLALGGRLQAQTPLPGLLWRILRRTVLLIAIGLLLNGFPSFDWSEIRISGVLQRIAICYAATALLVVCASPRMQVLGAVSLLALYAVLLLVVPVPGYGPGVLLPGRDLGAYLDRYIFGGREHLLFPRWDPEGLLSTLPAISTTLSGVLVTGWLRSGRRRFADFLRIGLPAVVAALLLRHWLPINKSLWTPSFVLLTSGAAVLVLGLCHSLVDEQGLRRWSRPWAALGANPIAIYVLSTLVDKLLLLASVPMPDGSAVTAKQALFHALALHVLSPNAASLIYALLYLLVWMALAEWLYRKGAFIRL
ncbi:MAG TPA: DUF5009 domain-containing protein [Candidatus Acidoferrales bacterium]|nr:DUF5009 domain-containing protein [Candidatus Acidoferrales bacterium]